MLDNKETTSSISIESQYIKDLSFENPGAPHSLGKKDISSPPQLSISLDIRIFNLQDNTFEVILHISANASIDDNEVLFIIDLSYAGVFTISDIEEEHYRFILSVHCPALLFPFARRIIANVTQDAGFQALMIDPVNFSDLFHKKILEEQNRRDAT